MHALRLALPIVFVLLANIVRAEDESGKAIYKKILNGTVFVVSNSGTGSGWVYDKEKKIVVTNYHVLRTAPPGNPNIKYAEDGIRSMLRWRDGR